ncbi:reverse transcriptase domain-containing protein [Tanacetum coccineum]|uniref:Reverse transcriptase domain-containing protein n=1 Tax=Tanacetum coccineum TaxID=301880 RepID=A0ABQ4XK33_9ASTR
MWEYDMGKNKQTPQDSVRTTSVVDLEEFCEKHYEKLLPIMAAKYEYEKRKKEKLEEVNDRTALNTRARKEEKAPCSRDWKTEEGVHPRTRTAVRSQLQRSKRSVPEKLPPTEKVHQRPHSAPQHQTKRTEVQEEFFQRFHEKILKIVDEMMLVATSFLQGQEEASKSRRKKVPQAWRHRKGGHRQNFKKGGGFRSQHKTEKRPDSRGNCRTYSGADASNGKEKEQPKKKGETSEKEKPQAILMIQSRQKAVRQKITQSFSPELEISFPSLGNDEERMALNNRSRDRRPSVECAAGLQTRGDTILRYKVKEERVKKWAINLENTGAVSNDKIAEHRLNVRKGCQPVRQKKRGQAAERNVAINDMTSHMHSPIGRLPSARNDWQSSKSLCGFPFKCFLDAYKGYHQIQMAEEDEEKTAFITNQGIFCYTKMPFGLRNAGATYQRLVDKAFHGQIGRNLEVYVDDLVIKSRTEDEVVRDIEETFKTLRKINMKLNPKKCTFGVEEGMFLGYQVNTKGIKICPDKVDAVLSLQSPKCLKEEAEAAFRQMKEHIAKLPMLTAPEEQEELIVYLAASKEAVSVVLMTEREARQMPIYFVSRALRGPEVNYTAMEKLVLALVHASKRLRRYFQAHPITVITDQSIKTYYQTEESLCRMQK